MTPLNYTFEDYREIGVPALIVIGDRDGMIPVGEALALHRFIAGSELAVVPAGNHSLPVLRPGRKKLWLPLGGAAAVGVFRNGFGDTNSLIKKKSFEALGGFIEDYGVGHDDWEFFARALLAGLKLRVIP